MSDSKLLFTLSLTQSPSLACACCCDVIYGAQDRKRMCFHADSLIFSLVCDNQSVSLFVCLFGSRSMCK